MAETYRDVLADVADNDGVAVVEKNLSEKYGLALKDLGNDILDIPPEQARAALTARAAARRAPPPRTEATPAEVDTFTEGFPEYAKQAIEGVQAEKRRQASPAFQEEKAAISKALPPVEDFPVQAQPAMEAAYHRAAAARASLEGQAPEDEELPERKTKWGWSPHYALGNAAGSGGQMVPKPAALKVATGPVGALQTALASAVPFLVHPSEKGEDTTPVVDSGSDLEERLHKAAVQGDEEYEKQKSYTRFQRNYDDLFNNAEGFFHLLAGAAGFAKMPEDSTAQEERDLGFEAGKELTVGQMEMMNYFIRHPDAIADRLPTFLMVAAPLKRSLDRVGAAAKSPKYAAFSKAFDVVEAATNPGPAVLKAVAHPIETAKSLSRAAEAVSAVVADPTGSKARKAASEARREKFVLEDAEKAAVERQRAEQDAADVKERTRWQAERELLRKAKEAEAEKTQQRQSLEDMIPPLPIEKPAPAPVPDVTSYVEPIRPKATEPPPEPEAPTPVPEGLSNRRVGEAVRAKSTVYAGDEPVVPIRTFSKDGITFVNYEGKDGRLHTARPRDLTAELRSKTNVPTQEAVPVPAQDPGVEPPRPGSRSEGGPGEPGAQEGKEAAPVAQEASTGVPAREVLGGKPAPAPSTTANFNAKADAAIEAMKQQQPLSAETAPTPTPMTEPGREKWHPGVKAAVEVMEAASAAMKGNKGAPSDVYRAYGEAKTAVEAAKSKQVANPGSNTLAAEASESVKRLVGELQKAGNNPLSRRILDALSESRVEEPPPPGDADAPELPKPVAPSPAELLTKNQQIEAFNVKIREAVAAGDQPTAKRLLAEQQALKDEGYKQREEGPLPTPERAGAAPGTAASEYFSHPDEQGVPSRSAWAPVRHVADAVKGGIESVGQKITDALRKVQARPEVQLVQPGDRFIATNPDDSKSDGSAVELLGNRASRLLDDGRVIYREPTRYDVTLDPGKDTARLEPKYAAWRQLNHEINDVRPNTVDPSNVVAGIKRAFTDLWHKVGKEGNPKEALDNDPKLRIMAEGFDLMNPEGMNPEMRKAVAEHLGVSEKRLQELYGELGEDPNFLNHAAEVVGYDPPSMRGAIKIAKGALPPELLAAIGTMSSQFFTPGGRSEQAYKSVERQARTMSLDAGSIIPNLVRTLTGTSGVLLLNEGMRKNLAGWIANQFGIGNFMFSKENRQYRDQIMKELENFATGALDPKSAAPSFNRNGRAVLPDGEHGWINHFVDMAGDFVDTKKLAQSTIADWIGQRAEAARRKTEARVIWRMAFEPFELTGIQPHSVRDALKAYLATYLVHGQTIPAVTFKYSPSELLAEYSTQKEYLLNEIAREFKVGPKQMAEQVRSLPGWEAELLRLANYNDKMGVETDFGFSAIKNRMAAYKPPMAAWYGGSNTGRTPDAFRLNEKGEVVPVPPRAEPLAGSDPNYGDVGMDRIFMTPEWRRTVGASMEIKDALARQMMGGWSWWRLDRWAKASLTSRNIATHVNNWMTNGFMAAMTSGDPGDIFRLHTLMAKTLAEQGARKLGMSGLVEAMSSRVTPDEAALMHAMSRVGSAEASQARYEITPLKSTSIEQKLFGGLDNVYAQGDAVPKVLFTMTEAKHVLEQVRMLKAGEHIELLTSPEATPIMRAQGAGEKNALLYVRDENGHRVLYEVAPRQRQTVLSGGDTFGGRHTERRVADLDNPKDLAALSDLVVKAASNKANNLFVDYRDVPMFVQYIRRYSPISSLVSPFMTWGWAMVDIPGFKRGAATSMANPRGSIGRTNSRAINLSLAGDNAAVALRRLMLIGAAKSQVDGDPDERRIRRSMINSLGANYGPAMLLELGGNTFLGRSLANMNPLKGSLTPFLALESGIDGVLDEMWRSGVDDKYWTASPEEMKVYAQVDPKGVAEATRMRRMAVSNSIGRDLPFSDVLGMMGAGGGLLASMWMKAEEAKLQGGHFDTDAAIRALMPLILSGTGAKGLDTLMAQVVSAKEGIPTDQVYYQHPGMAALSGRAKSMEHGDTTSAFTNGVNGMMGAALRQGAFSNGKNGAADKIMKQAKDALDKGIAERIKQWPVQEGSDVKDRNQEMRDKATKFFEGITKQTLADLQAELDTMQSHGK